MCLYLCIKYIFKIISDNQLNLTYSISDISVNFIIIFNLFFFHSLIMAENKNMITARKFCAELNTKGKIRVYFVLIQKKLLQLMKQDKEKYNQLYKNLTEAEFYISKIPENTKEFIQKEKILYIVDNEIPNPSVSK